MQHDLTIYQCAQALRDGRNPIEVADMLDGVADSMNREAEQGAGIDLTNPAQVFTLDLALSRIADLESRHADFTRFAQRVDDRLYNLQIAMRECANKEALHPSVRFICDTIALNLAAPTAAVPATDSESIRAELQEAKQLIYDLRQQWADDEDRHVVEWMDRHRALAGRIRGTLGEDEGL